MSSVSLAVLIFNLLPFTDYFAIWINEKRSKSVNTAPETAATVAAELVGTPAAPPLAAAVTVAATLPGPQPTS